MQSVGSHHGSSDVHTDCPYWRKMISSEEIAASVDEEVDYVVEAEAARQPILEDTDIDFVPLDNDDDNLVFMTTIELISEFEGRPQSSPKSLELYQRYLTLRIAHKPWKS